MRASASSACIVRAVRRISEGFPLSEFTAEDGDENVRDAAREIAAALQQLAEKPLAASEVH